MMKVVLATVLALCAVPAFAGPVGYGSSCASELTLQLNEDPASEQARKRKLADLANPWIPFQSGGGVDWAGPAASRMSGVSSPASSSRSNPFSTPRFTPPGYFGSGAFSGLSGGGLSSASSLSSSWGGGGAVFFASPLAWDSTVLLTVPEPSTVLLFALGGAALVPLARRYRRGR